MTAYSTRETAKKLGIAMSTLLRHITLGKVRGPKSATSGGMTIHFWTDEEIEDLRKLLPKIANGRKTRYKKKQLAISNSQLAKAKGKTKSKKKK